MQVISSQGLKNTMNGPVLLRNDANYNVGRCPTSWPFRQN